MRKTSSKPLPFSSHPFTNVSWNFPETVWWVIAQQQIESDADSDNLFFSIKVLKRLQKC